jgi:hypothetical protein
MVVVPTHAAAAHLVRALKMKPLGRVCGRGFAGLGDTQGTRAAVGERLSETRPRLTEAEREVLLGVACRSAADQGAAPPFHLRPGLVAEILRFYDELKRRQNSVDDFERHSPACSSLAPPPIAAPSASCDRRASWLPRSQFRQRSVEHGEDEHRLRTRLVTERSSRPLYAPRVDGRRRSRSIHAAYAPADWDLLTRIPGLERLDVVVTDTLLASALHERMHRMLPGIEEIGGSLATHEGCLCS